MYNKYFFNYKSNIILTNGSLIKIKLIKYFKNLELNLNNFNKNLIYKKKINCLF